MGEEASQSISENQALQACQILFGANIDLSPGFLQYLRPSGVRAAYLRRAKEVHPDRHIHEDPSLQQKQNALFRQLVEAMETASNYLKQRPIRLAAQKTASRYYRGPIPQLPLKIGMYLYYRGLIHTQHLIDALTWQRRQRASIGQLAKQWGWLDDQGIHAILCNRDRLVKFGKFGERARDMGYLTTNQVKGLLWLQRAQQEKLGQYFVQAGVVTPVQMERLVVLLKKHNAQAARKPKIAKK